MIETTPELSSKLLEVRETPVPVYTRSSISAYEIAAFIFRLLGE
jgi:hypothetical protein